MGAHSLTPDFAQLSMQNRRGRTSTAATGVLLLVFCAVSFVLRVMLGARAVSASGVSFLETDAWYHMRLADSLVHNFPFRIWFDPYLLHPGGQVTQVAPMLDWLIAGTALLLGAGRPSPLLVDLVGAYIPPVVGALTTLPVYFLGRELFSRRAGLFGAAIVGLLPGEVLVRSLLGFTDHHCVETLMSATTLALMMFALNRTLPRRRRIVYAVLTGFGLGTYLLTWSAGGFLVAILCAWGLGYQALERLRNVDATDEMGVLVLSFGVAAFMMLPWADTTRSFAQEAIGLAAGLIAIPVVWALGRLVRGRAAYLGGLLLAGGAGTLALSLLSGPLLATALREMRGMSPFRVETVLEAMPLYKTQVPFPLWRQFTASVYLALFALGTRLPDMLRRASARHTLFLTWTAATVAATLGQVRFSYYLAVSVAALAGAGCDLLLRWSGEVGSRIRANSAAPTWWARRWRDPAWRGSLVSALLALVIVAPSVPYFEAVTEGNATSPEHIDAFRWMRQNTPDPFDDPGVYDRVFRPSPNDPSSYPAASYGVMAPWPLGYPLIRIARRVPNASGNQAGTLDLSAFLLAQDEDEANGILTRLNTRYVVTDWQMVEGHAPASQFASYVLGAARNPQDYREVFYRRDSSGRLQPVVLYYPSYYRAMVTRLQSFGGASVIPSNSTWVISFSDRLQGSTSIKEIQTERLFSRYDDAVAFVASANSGRYRIVGPDPFVSCVPIPALREYVPVYRSLTEVATSYWPQPPAVRIFEYRRWNPRSQRD